MSTNIDDYRSTKILPDVWVEEVDSGKELRFHSTGELIQFLGERFRGVSITSYGSGPVAGFWLL